MDFLGMGWGEIFLILIIALLIFGPSRMVEISRSLGKLTRSLKKATSDLTSEITREIDEEKKILAQPPGKTPAQASAPPNPAAPVQASPNPAPQDPAPLNPAQHEGIGANEHR